jgi:hypothetical protein
VRGEGRGGGGLVSLVPRPQLAADRAPSAPGVRWRLAVESWELE